MLQKCFKAKLTSSRETITSLEENLAQTGSELEHLRGELDRKRGEGERFSLQLAEISGNAMTNAQSLTSRNESLQKMVSLVDSFLLFLFGLNQTLDFCFQKRIKLAQKRGDLNHKTN